MVKDSEIVEYKVGDVILNEGERSSDLFILKKGKIAIFKGPNRITEIDKKDTLVGEMSFFLGQKRSATVIAESDCQFEKISMQGVSKLISEDKKFGTKIIEELSSKLSKTTEDMKELHKLRDFHEAIETYAKTHINFKNFLKSYETNESKKEDHLKIMLNEKSLMSKQVLLPFIEQTKKALCEMLEEEVTFDEPYPYSEKLPKIDAASIVNLIGEFKGWYVMGFSKKSILKMTNRFTDKNDDYYSQDVINFIKEINNILIGWVIGAMSAYKFTISTPTAFFGKNAIKNMIGKSPALIVPFHTKLGDFYIIIYIEIIK